MVKQAVQSDSAAAAALAHVFPAAMLPIATLVLERPSEAIAMLPWDITLR